MNAGIFRRKVFCTSVKIQTCILFVGGQNFRGHLSPAFRGHELQIPEREAQPPYRYLPSSWGHGVKVVQEDSTKLAKGCGTKKLLAYLIVHQPECGSYTPIS